MTIFKSLAMQNIAIIVIRSFVQFFTFFALSKIGSSFQVGQYFAVLSVVALSNSILDLGSYSILFLMKSRESVKSPISSILSFLMAVLPVSLLINFTIISFMGIEIPISLFLAVAINDICIRMIGVIQGNSIFDGYLGRILRIEIIIGFLRLSTSVIFIFNDTAIEYLILTQMILSVIGVGLAMKSSREKIVLSYVSAIKIKDFMYEGLSYAIANTLSIGISEIEKPILSKYTNLSDLGIYSMGQRIYSVCLLPLSAYISTRYQYNFSGSLKQRKHNLKKTLINSFSIGILLSLFLKMIVFFNLVPAIFGKEYVSANKIISVLAFSLVVQALYIPLADFISGTGRQKLRMFIQFGSLVIYFVTLMYNKDNLSGIIASKIFLIVSFVNLIMYTLSYIIFGRNLKEDSNDK